MIKCPECMFEYEELTSLNRHFVRTHKKTSENLYLILFPENIKICACGCNEKTLFKSITKGYQKYLHGHNSKPKIKFDKSIEKYCPKCEKVLSLDKFGIRKDSQKYQSYCNFCCLEYRRNQKDKINKRSRLWYKNNKNKVMKRMNNRFHSDINYKLILNCRRYVNQKIRQNIVVAKKQYKTLELLGCTIEELKKHLEDRFENGMSWENYGANGWHIDHVIPCSLFDFSDSEQQQKCFHYKNLSPMWAKENISKGNKIQNKNIQFEKSAEGSSVLINGHKITKYMIEKMNPLEKEDLIKCIFDFYKNNNTPECDFEKLLIDFQ